MILGVIGLGGGWKVMLVLMQGGTWFSHSALSMKLGSSWSAMFIIMSGN